ncbi:helix-turn-helix domain-containing protein [Streptosporangium sp. NPDC049376]|uniref:AraC-like ligand-binding domain-containing protein n=1 Tax=Streptosporangium sp. NPDC049376 TaxID=3366192 RepID=UPI0037A5DFA9
MRTVIHTDGVAPAERFEYWRHLVSQTLLPLEVVSESPADFHGEMRSMDFGAVHISKVSCSDIWTHRTMKHIRQSEPELLQVAIPLRGHGAVVQGREHVAMGPSNIVVYNSWNPYSVLTTGDDEGTIQGIFAMVPRTMLHLPETMSERCTPWVFSSREGVGALLLGFLGRLVTDADRFQPGEVTRLGVTALDLLTMLLAGEKGTTPPPDTRQRVLLARIHAFIHRRLADPALSPETIAAAHNISVRALHRLFLTEERTVAAWIRALRLDHCRRDLANPQLEGRPAHAVAARWGLTDAAHFTRAFRTAYGITPQAYRRLHISGRARA